MKHWRPCAQLLVCVKLVLMCKLLCSLVSLDCVDAKTYRHMVYRSHKATVILWYHHSTSCNLCQTSCAACLWCYLRCSCSYFVTLVWHTWAVISQGLKQTNISPVPTEWPLKQENKAHKLQTHTRLIRLRFTFVGFTEYYFCSSSQDVCLLVMLFNNQSEPLECVCGRFLVVSCISVDFCDFSTFWIDMSNRVKNCRTIPDLS